MFKGCLMDLENIFFKVFIIFSSSLHLKDPVDDKNIFSVLFIL